MLRQLLKLITDTARSELTGRIKPPVRLFGEPWSLQLSFATVDLSTSEGLEASAYERGLQRAASPKPRSLAGPYLLPNVQPKPELVP